MLITIVTITKDILKKNGKQKLIACIDSVCDQVLSENREIEHIFIDGASSDGTVEFIKNYRSNVVQRKVISEPDSGIYDAMNKGIYHSSGEVILFLNADDCFCRTDAIELSVNALLKSGADISYGYWRRDENGKLGFLRTAELGLFFLRMPFCHQTMLTKRKVIENIGGFDSKNFRSAGDFDLVLRLLLNKCSCVEVPYELVHFSAGGMSSNGSLSNSEVIFSMKKNIEQLKRFSDREIETMFYSMSFPKAIFCELQQEVSVSVLEKMNSLLKNLNQYGNSYCYDNILGSRYFSEIPEEQPLNKFSCIEGFRFKIYKKLSQVGILRWLVRSFRKQLSYIFHFYSSKSESCTRGGTYFFNQEQPKIQLYSFSDIEPSGRWALGEKSKIRFKLGDSRESTLRIFCTPFLTNNQPEIKVKLYTTEDVYVLYTLKSTEESKLTVPIPSSKEDFKNIVTLSIETTAHVSPSSAGISNDSRPLSLLIRKIEIE